MKSVSILEKRNFRHTHLIMGIMFLSSMLFTCSDKDSYETRQLTGYVNPYIGADRTSNNLLGPLMPWGSVQPQPDTYHVNFAGYLDDEPIRGFSQTRLTGGGGPPAYGNLLISPQIGLEISPDGHDSPKSAEKPSCTSYSVNLDRYDIKAEITPTHHAALYRFTFPESSDAHIILDMGYFLAQEGMRNNKHHWYKKGSGLQAGKVTVDVENQNMKGWGTYKGGYHGPYTIYFCARFSKAPVTGGTWHNGIVKEHELIQHNKNPEDKLGGYFKFETQEREPILVKIGVSFKSLENAEKFVNDEIPDFDFAQVEQQCEKTWNKYLSNFLVDDPNITPDEKTKFYTAVWRTAHQPHDRTGDSPLWETGEPYWDDQFCTWDSWRTLYPLLTLVKPSFTRDNIQCYIKRRSIGHFVGDSFLSGHDSEGGQGGDDVDNVIADAFKKDIPGVDWEAAYEVLKHHAENGRRVNDGSDGDTYRQQGWVPAPIWSSVSKTLEFAYNDFLIAEMAKELGKEEDYKKYIVRSQKWETLWDPEAESLGFMGFMHTRKADGSWAPFDPTDGKYPGGKGWEGYYEGQSWIYSYFVPHDFARLVELMGGEDRFIERLKFGLGPNYQNRRLLNASNEPGFYLSLLFHYAGRPDLSSEYIRDFELPTFTMENYGGQEDQGALSARYIWLLSGIYPIAGQETYLLHGPRYQKMIFQLENGKKLEIIGKNASQKNKYVQSLSVNGKSWDQSWLTHAEIANGGTLVFEMGPEPSNWAHGEKAPPSLSEGGF